MDKHRIMVVAGEASGDLHASRLIRAMQAKHSGLDFYGIGGPLMKAARTTILFDSSRLSVVGITEVLFKLADIAEGMKTAKAFLRSHKPDLLILVDFPDFNIRLAKAAKDINIPVLYYISPQIWAWRRGRVLKMKKIVDHVAVILPFEEKFYQAHGVPVTFVGHPLLDQDVPPQISRPQQASRQTTRMVGLVPGSRDGEIARHLPIMLAAALDIKARQEDAVRFIVPVAPSIEKAQVAAIIEACAPLLDVEMDSAGAANVFEKCDLIVTASGTVTLEAAIAGIPMIIIYKVSSITYRLARILIQVDAIGLVNLIAGKKIVPELVQNEANPATIADWVTAMLNDPQKLESMRADLLKIGKKLGGSGASERTAEIALRMLK